MTALGVGDVAKTINDGLVKCSVEQKISIFAAAVAVTLISVPDYKKWLEKMRDEAENLIERTNSGNA